jgi:hypothetical protein
MRPHRNAATGPTLPRANTVPPADNIRGHAFTDAHLHGLAAQT